MSSSPFGNHPLRTTEVFTRTWAIYRYAFVPFLVAGALIILPTELVRTTVVASLFPMEGSVNETLRGFFASMLFGSVFGVLYFGAITAIVSDAIVSGDLSIRQALVRSVRRVPSMTIFVWLTWTFGIFSLITIVGIPVSVLIFGVWMLGAPALLDEELSVGAALMRGFAFVRRYPILVFAYAAIGFLIYPTTLFVSILTVGFVIMRPFGLVLNETTIVHSIFFYMLFSYAQILAQSLFFCAASVMYFDLRARTARTTYALEAF